MPSDLQRARTEREALEALYLNTCSTAPCHDTDAMLAAAYRFMSQVRSHLASKMAEDAK
ncbi:hypothetical protein SLH49_18795 [Cognatiyoonia sp. IB215446]|uniref:hypothetical protein n=1 Tax=Cognatiyoonia sp. IB215446 TaxID=3097355 RepID=UPI002A108F55|nr:hypothetical protein [Cognatiyoonia sp. IB215446]MDX8350043.1 hypothetical protein [Cognatiyoonia sp. IB215446]